MNRLASESSPYLLQHQTNPVDWYPWSEEAFEKAKSENKLVLISIGYSACHWCHVMEHESFEDNEVAEYMNEHFVNIKVDREERPDVDHIYMSAVQLMTQRGGWPLNCFVLPNGKPFYGGTYFPKDQWLHIMKQLVHIQSTEPEKLIEYSDHLAEGIENAESIELNLEVQFSKDYIDETIEKWRHQFDWNEGGMNRAPKFPMPTNYLFLQDYGETAKDKVVLDFLDLTLKKMARGGIYDQIGGGFCRYSVDGEWKVPHFEKMLYDNGQLLSLYSIAYARTGEKEYLHVINSITAFIKSELLAENHGFYSAMDADSEGVEGKYYIWSQGELKDILGDDFEFAKDYFNVNELGYWEEGNYILLRAKFLESEQLTRVEKELLQERDKRVKPGLDNKILASWNGLMSQGFLDAFRVTGNEEFLNLALNNLNFILRKMKTPEGTLYHTHQLGEAKISGFSEDYAFIIQALISAFEATSDEKWLIEADDLMKIAIEYFFSDENGMFNFTSRENADLIASKQETQDNVTPASNSQLAINLYKLGEFYGRPSYIKMAQQMLKNVWPLITNFPNAYSNWGRLSMHILGEQVEVVVSGPNSDETVKRLKTLTHPSVPILNCSKVSELPIFKGRFTESETSIFVCKDGSCMAPVASIEEALSLF